MQVDPGQGLPPNAPLTLPVVGESNAALTTDVGLPIGEIVADSGNLTGVDGQRYTLASFAENEVLVLAFLGNACPAVKALAGELTAFQGRFAAAGVRVIGINSNNQYLSPRDTPVEMARWASESAINFVYLKDAEGTFARAVGATNTPHFLALDRARRLRYRGRMFDSRDPARATTRDLERAVEAILGGRPVDVPVTNPLGCSIVW